MQSQDPMPEISMGNVQLQQLSLSSDTKQEFETGPCRIRLKAILQELKAPLYLSGEDIFIPNCDTRGFYRRKQIEWKNSIVLQAAISHMSLSVASVLMHHKNQPSCI
uniref:Uncharacterized protein n=1 Tax=Sphaerodactylus townsendi TaxID=933632 RepID=A0ACB8EML7_9SAUR